MIDFSEIGESVIEGDVIKTQRLAKAALDANVPAKEILDRGLIPSMRKFGDLFEGGEYFLPELLAGGEAMSKALEILSPILSNQGVPFIAKFLVGTVQGDMHNIGKNIVAMVLKGNGWEVTDLGIDVAPEDFCSAVREGDFQILGMSSLLTTTMPNAGKTIEALKAAGLRDKVKIMVGGAPVTKKWADKIGADGYATDGVTTVKVAAALIGK